MVSKALLAGLLASLGAGPSVAPAAEAPPARNGETLLVVTFSRSATRVMLVDVARGAMRPVTRGPYRGAAWSPDGQLLAVARDARGRPAASRLEVRDATGTR